MADRTQASRTYLGSIQKDAANGVATEHTYRPALKTFLDSLDKGINAINEPRRIECGAPDLSVTRTTGHGPLTLGYVEAKDLGTDLAAIERDSERASPSSRDGRQLRRYRDSLPNLILTDYLEFRWYVDGQRRSAVRVASVDSRGRLLADKDGGSSVLALMGDFLAHQPEAISRPKELAERMARLTHLVRDVVVEAFEKDLASPTIRSLREAFAEVLIPDLTVPGFADMFAQTLSYGLFAAYVEHDLSRGPFRRQEAAREIPRTNPFLRRLFTTIAGPDLDDEPFVGLVDDLAQLLASTDMAAVLADFGKREARTDPVMHFYETFLAAYDPALREMRGVYYTPEPVVSYIVRSVDHLLRSRFNCPDGLADTSAAAHTRTGEDGQPHTVQVPRVLVLDPACGTGTFLYSVIDLVRSEFTRQGNAGKWSGYVREGLLPRLFGFELLMAPYAMAHLKLGMQLAAKDLPEQQRRDWAYDFSSGERLGVYLTNTLEKAMRRSQMLMGQFISEEANAAADIKRERPIMVVLGNPPYSGLSANMGEWIVGLLKGRLPSGEQVPSYYEVDGKPLKERKVWLQDDYVKFIRFGQWRIQQTGQGVLAFITNHGYLDNPTFRGMRQQLMNAFTDIYILDLHGGSRKREQAPDGGPDENVFDIQQGVAIGVFIKEPGKDGPATVHHASLWGTRESKYAWLMEQEISTTNWRQLAPASPFYLFVPQGTTSASEYQDGWKVTDIIPVSTTGIVTARDHFVVDSSEAALLDRVQDLRSDALSDDEIRRKYFQGKGAPQYAAGDSRGWKLPEARKRVREDTDWRKRIVPCLYRPFDVRPLYYVPWMVDWPRREVMRHMLSGENLGLAVGRAGQVIGPDEWTIVFATRAITDFNLYRRGGNNLSPLYLYPVKGGEAKEQADMVGLSPWPEGKDGRRPNLSPEFVKELEQRLGLTFVPVGQGDLAKTFGPEDAFHYIYAVVHSPSYRERYAKFLKMDFPRIHLTSKLDLFRVLVAKGKELVALHLLESPALGRPSTRYPVPGDNIVEPGHPRYLAPGEPEPGASKPLTQGRVYISRDNPRTGKRGQYIDGVPPEVWEFQVGGYQVCDKWLKDRRGRALTNTDIEHYEEIVVALQQTIHLMAEIDETIDEHGGWPLQGNSG